MSEGMRHYIETKEYFIDSRKWYYGKYIAPIAHRSIIASIIVLLLLLLLILAININSLLPLVKQLKYFISVSGSSDKYAKIVKAEGVANNPLRSILKIMLEDYVVQRESYEYSSLEDQIKYVHKTSNRRSFNQFYDYLNIDNQYSPVLRYQEEARRTINVIKTVFVDDSEVQVYFDSKAVDSKGQSFEELSWVSYISFDADPIQLHLASGTPFRFIVTDYKLKLIGDKLNAKK